MKSVINRLVEVYFDKKNKHWNKTIFVKLYEDDEPKLLGLIREHYKNMGKVERIEIKSTDIRESVDLRD